MSFTILNTPWICVGWHPRWVLWYWCNEAGLAVLQIGPLILEIPTQGE